MKRILGIDYGDARTGISITDALNITAQGLETINNKGSDKVILKRLDELFSIYEVDTIVIGRPINMNGTESERTEITDKFIHKLKCKYNTLKIETIDERLTYEGVASVKIKDKLDLVENTDYKVDYNEEKRLLTIIFKNESMDFSENIKNNTDGVIEIRFNTKFATDENGKIIGINQSIPNQATLVYGNNNRLDSETPEIHTGGVGIYKYDSTTKKALVGAHFKIATSEENAKNKIFLKDTNGKDIEAITDENGKAEFTRNEIADIKERYNLTDQEVVEIFLS